MQKAINGGPNSKRRWNNENYKFNFSRMEGGKKNGREFDAQILIKILIKRRQMVVKGQRDAAINSDMKNKRNDGKDINFDKEGQKRLVSFSLDADQGYANTKDARKVEG